MYKHFNNFIYKENIIKNIIIKNTKIFCSDIIIIYLL